MWFWSMRPTFRLQTFHHQKLWHRKCIEDGSWIRYFGANLNSLRPYFELLTFCLRYWRKILWCTLRNWFNQQSKCQNGPTVSREQPLHLAENWNGSLDIFKEKPKQNTFSAKTVLAVMVTSRKQINNFLRSTIFGAKCFVDGNIRNFD